MAYPALLLISVLLIMCLPFIPALHEWLRPSDVAPLPVRRNEINNLRYFADSFRLTIANMSAINLPKLQSVQTDRTISISDQLHVVHQRLTDASADYQPATLKLLRQKTGIVIFVHDARLPPNSSSHADLFAAADLLVGDGASLRACSAQGVITLGANAVVHRWIDAPSIHVGSNAAIDGRITALKEITFSEGSRFVRAGAPTMCFGYSAATAEAAPQAPSPRPRHVLEDGAQQSAALIQNGDYVVRGVYRIHPGTTVFGNIKTYGDLHLGEQSSIAGSLVSNKDIVLARACSVLGPVISQNDIVIGPDCRIGTPDAATTMICRKLTIAAGCMVHGVITTQDGAIVTSPEMSHAS
jgi:cytoskeletal protein CcmA (bactofilin family)